MEDPIDRGLPFVMVDPWQPAVSGGAASQHDSLFESLDTTLPPLELSKHNDVPSFELDVIIPELEDREEALEPVAKAFEAANQNQDAFGENIDTDPWNLESLLNDQDEKGLCTWESFEKNDVSNSEQTALISEAGPAAFDAAINLLPELRNEIGVLPQDYALRALCNLVLGRSSTLFQWNPEIKRFEQTLKGASVTGISQICSESLATDLIEVGSTITKLRAITDRERSTRLPSASLALRSCITSVLNAIDESISEQLGTIHSLLQLQRLVAIPQPLLLVLETLVESAKDCNSDESVISSISDRIFEEAQTQYDLCPVLRALLARVSVPWLERLAADLGFCSTQTALASGYASGDDDMKCLENAVTFLRADDTQLIRETKQAIKLLRSQDEYHPLLEDEDQGFMAIVYPTLDRNEVSDMSKGYEQKMLARLRHVGTVHVPATTSTISVGLAETDVWTDGPSQQAFLDQTAALMSGHINIEMDVPTDLLYEKVLSLCRLQTHVSATEMLDLATDLSTTPLERIRPLIQTQQRLVNGILLRRLFREHNLRHHLELQKEYQLFGSGDFVLRLSTALFSQETQSAERTRGATLTGEVMGLRLGTTHEERWPPASSELQLTLMGILNETYSRRQPQKIKTYAHASTLPGALSFSIRKLPEAEIDRVLDPNSVYALDFLRLQYTTAPPLDAVITTDTLDKYDGMFRFLLRLLRVVHIAVNLHRAPSLHREHEMDTSACKFAKDASHFVCILMSHTMELGINAPWRRFMKSVDGLSKLLGQEDDAGEIGTKSNLGVEGLRQLHEWCLESIRSRLFLKRRQEKLRKVVEEALDAILKGGLALQRNDLAVRAVFEENSRTFQQSAKQVCKLLQEHVDKPLKTTSATEAEELEVNKILLSRLNWNEYYE